MNTLTRLEEKHIFKESSDLQCELIANFALCEEVIRQFEKKGENLHEETDLNKIFDDVSRILYSDKSQKRFNDKRGELWDFLSKENRMHHSIGENPFIKLRSGISEIFLKDLLQTIVEKVKDLLKSSACLIYLKSDKKDEFARQKALLKANIGFDRLKKTDISFYPVIPSIQVKEKELTENDKLGITGWVISKGCPFISNNMEEIAYHIHHHDRNDNNIKLASMLAFPVSNPNGDIIGAIKVEGTDELKQFSLVDQMFLETIAKVVGRCVVHNKDFIERQSNTVISAWIFDIISDALEFEEELDNFLDSAVHAISAASSADSCSIFLIDKEERTLTQRAGSGNQILKNTIRSYILPKSKGPFENAKISDLERRIGLTPHIASTGEKYYAKNFKELQAHPAHLGKFDTVNYTDKTNCGAWFGVPIKVGSRIKGVLKIENESKKIENDSKSDLIDSREFSLEVQDRVDIIAQRIGLSIESFMLRGMVHNEIFEGVGRVIQKISSGRADISEIVGSVVTETMILLKAQACALFLKEGNQLIQPKWAAQGWSQKGPNIRTYDLVDKIEIKEFPINDSDKVGLTVWIAAMQKKFIAKSNLELIKFPHHKGFFDDDNFPDGKKCEAFMGFPLIVDNELIGVLKVESKMRTVNEKPEFTYFSEQDEIVFDLLAKSVAIAIHNARKVELEKLNRDLLPLSKIDDVIIVLLNFCNGRQAVITTLLNAAERNKENEGIHKCILNFIALLYPKFEIARIEELRNKVKGHLETWFGYLHTALTINSKEDIQTFNCDVKIFENNFLLIKSAEILSSTKDKLLIEFRHFDFKPKVDSLSACNKVFEAKIVEIEKINIFEQSLLKQVITHWKAIVEKALISKVVLKEIKLNNLAFFGDLTWTLGSKMNILLGKNGYGKTNLLQLMASLLRDDLIVIEKYFDQNSNKSYIELSFNMDGVDETFLFKKKVPESNGKNQNVVSNRHFEKIPILAIPDIRFINKSKSTLSYFGDDDKDIGLRNNGAVHFIYQKPFEAVIQNFLYQLCIDYLSNNKNFNSPKFELLLSIVKSLTDKEFAFKNVENMENGIMKLEVSTEGEDILPIQQASQGTISILAIFGLIYDFLQSLFPKSPERNILKEHAIVFIDEIGAHLHPSWQQKIVGLLRNSFPNVQFILTAHSPLVVAGCFENEISVLRKRDNGIGHIVETFHENFLGITTPEMYRKIFDIEDMDKSYLSFLTQYVLKERTKTQISELEHKTNKTSEDLEKLTELKNSIYYAEEAQKKENERKTLK